jgi:hypothetical protein
MLVVKNHDGQRMVIGHVLIVDRPHRRDADCLCSGQGFRYSLGYGVAVKG